MRYVPKWEQQERERERDLTTAESKVITNSKLKNCHSFNEIKE
jgi:hypothetical protein